MEFEDLATLNQIGRGLWSDEEKAKWITHDSVSTSAFLTLPPDRQADRVGLLMLKRAESAGAETNLNSLNQPFYRLHAEERFILSALHHGKWNYSRVGNIIGESPTKIEELAWRARVHLYSLVSQEHPVGGAKRALNCPEYDHRRPWTQKFMDEAFSKSEYLYLQKHLIGCESCRRSLEHCRKLYYRVQTLIPAYEQSALIHESNALEENLAQTERVLDPTKHTFKSSLEVFFDRWDTRLAFYALVTLVSYRIFTWMV